MKTVSRRIRAAAKTFEARFAIYGDNYTRFGPIMKALVAQNGTPLNKLTEADWNRLGVLVMIVSKVQRYAQALPTGGHRDSAHDGIAYNAILESLTK